MQMYFIILKKKYSMSKANINCSLLHFITHVQK